MKERREGVEDMQWRNEESDGGRPGGVVRSRQANGSCILNLVILVRCEQVLIVWAGARAAFYWNCRRDQNNAKGKRNVISQHDHDQHHE
ncbi:unnamed protein product [Amoebophrya sp. A25]|nr:unnamed protein product [Amoebophrya sp. A25]|eukprot:GSA25T00013788001.1